MEIINPFIRNLLRIDEGERAQPYQDSKKIWTVGDGHNLEANGLPAGIFADAPEGMPYPECLHFLQKRGGLTRAELDAMLDRDIESECAWLFTRPWWPAANAERQAALMDMSFNLGPGTMQTFQSFLGLVAAGLWDDASNDLLKTKVAQMLPERYARLARIIRTGSMDGIYTT